MPEHVSITYDHPGKCPICGMTLVPVTPSELKQLQPGGKVLYYTCPMPEHNYIHEDKPGKCPDLRHDAHSRDGAAGHSHEFSQPANPRSRSSTTKPAAKQLYTCPMHPDVISDKPGQCPKCGMNSGAGDGHREIARKSSCSTHHRFFAQEQVHRPAGDGGAGARRHLRACKNIPLDAIPDLSDTQVIIYTPWEGQAPNIVEDQVTYPITTKMLSVPRAKVVRGYSFYGYSFVYVIFDDGTDPYWARSRVLEYLSSISGQLPQAASRPRSARTPPVSAGRSCIPSIRPTATSPICARFRTGI